MGRPKGSTNVKWDKDELFNLYWEKELSSAQIGKLLGYPAQCIQQALRILGIPRRNRSQATSGRLHYSWKGADYKYTNHQGYIMVRAPSHPQANNSGFVLEHRLIIEQSIGRYLKSSEIVHHLNGIRSENRRENLIWFAKKTHDNLIPSLQKRIRQLEEQLRGISSR